MKKSIKTALVLSLTLTVTTLMSSLALAADSTAVFAGFNVEEKSSYYYAGGVYALNGDVAKEGIVIRGQAAYGEYEYKTMGVLGGDVDAKQTRFHGGLGYQWVSSGFRTSVYAGADLQDHDLSPNDRRNNVRGSKDGLITQAEIESLTTPVYFSGIAGYSTVFDTYWGRARGGMPIGDLKLGAEFVGSGNESHDSKKLGLFVIVPASKTISVDISVGHFNTDGNSNRRDIEGTYFGANLITQF